MCSIGTESDKSIKSQSSSPKYMSVTSKCTSFPIIHNSLPLKSKRFWYTEGLGIDSDAAQLRCSHWEIGTCKTFPPEKTIKNFLAPFLYLTEMLERQISIIAVMDKVLTIISCANYLAWPEFQEIDFYTMKYAQRLWND